MMPYEFPGAKWAEGEFSKVNIISRFSNKNDDPNTIDVDSEEENRTEIKKENESVKQCCLNPTFLIFSVVFAIYSTRIKCIQGNVDCLAETI